VNAFVSHWQWFNDIVTVRMKFLHSQSSIGGRFKISVSVEMAFTQSRNVTHRLFQSHFLRLCSIGVLLCCAYSTGAILIEDAHLAIYERSLPFADTLQSHNAISTYLYQLVMNFGEGNTFFS
jgi:hypothetical protein